MKKRLNITLTWLIILTVTTAIISGFENFRLAPYLILILAAVKFNLVAFEFMELRSAHAFWKFLVIFYSLVFVGIYTIILSS